MKCKIDALNRNLNGLYLPRYGATVVRVESSKAFGKEVPVAHMRDIWGVFYKPIDRPTLFVENIQEAIRKRNK